VCVCVCMQKLHVFWSFTVSPSEFSEYSEAGHNHLLSNPHLLIVHDCFPIPLDTIQSLQLKQCY